MERAKPEECLSFLCSSLCFCGQTGFLLGKCPTNCQLVEGFVSRPFPEASTSWQLVGHRAPRFSFFQGAATGMKDSSENQPRKTKSTKVFSDLSSCSSFLRG